jgi:hypothetical protein
MLLQEEDAHCGPEAGFLEDFRLHQLGELGYDHVSSRVSPRLV